MSDVTDLKAEVLLLRRENAKLRELMYERAHVYAIQNMTEDELRITATNVMEDNAKLRELVRRLLDEYRYMRVRPRRMYLEHETRMRIIEDEMRSLGIEVPA